MDTKSRFPPKDRIPAPQGIKERMNTKSRLRSALGCIALSAFLVGVAAYAQTVRAAGAPDVLLACGAGD